MQRVVNGVLAAVLLVSIGAFVAVPRSEAFVIWCWDDPIVSVNGTIFEIDIAVGAEGGQAEVQANVQVAETTIYVPNDAQMTKISMTRVSFNETVRFVKVDGQNDVRIVVSFKSKKNLPAAVALKKAGVQVRQGTTEKVDGQPAFMGTTSSGVTLPRQSLP